MGQSVVMRVTGPYEYVDPPQALPCISDYRYQHQRKAVPTGCNPQAVWNEASGQDGVRALHQAIVGNALILCQFPVECQDGQTRRVTDGKVYLVPAQVTSPRGYITLS